MPFNIFVTLLWFLFGITIPFLSGFATHFFTRHYPPASVNLNVGLFTSTISYILAIFWPLSSLLWVLFVNLAVFALLPLWWKTDESRKWLIWGVYVTTNTLVNLIAIWVLISLLRS